MKRHGPRAMPFLRFAPSFPLRRTLLYSDLFLHDALHVLPHGHKSRKAVVPALDQRAGGCVHLLLQLRPGFFLKVIFPYDLRLLLIQLGHIKLQLLNAAPQ